MTIQPLCSLSIIDYTLSLPSNPPLKKLLLNNLKLNFYWTHTL